MSRKKDIDLKHDVVAFLEKLAKQYKSFPQSVTPTYIGEEIGCYIPRIGVVAYEVVRDLKDRGISVKYERNNNNRRFVIMGLKT